MTEWKEFKLGDVCESVSETYSRNDENVVLINTSDVLEGKFLTHETTKNVNLKGQFKKTFKKNDILYSEIRPANKRYAFVNFQHTENYIASTKLMVIRPIQELVLPKFLYRILTSTELINEMQHLAETRSGTFPQITFSGELATYPISLPPLPTQQKIAAILSSLDDKIELNNRINDNLEQQAQAIYDKMFVDDMNNVFLGDVIETTSGGTPSRKVLGFYMNGDNCWVKSKELESRFIIDTEEKITEEAIEKSSAKLLPKNSVLIAMYGATVGAYGIISKDMTCNQAICALLPNDNYPYSYLFMFAKNIRHELENLAVGSAQQNISQVLIKKLKVHSDTTKTSAFHSFTHSMFEQMLVIQQENNNLSALRDTLLPKLMSGEIEVQGIEI